MNSNNVTSYSIIAVLLLTIVGVLLYLFDNEVPATKDPQLNINSDFMLSDLEEIAAPDIATSSEIDLVTDPESDVVASSSRAYEVVAENLTIPWDIVFLPNNRLLVAERGGTILELNRVSGDVVEVRVPEVLHAGEGGLLGVIAHPNFEQNNFLYLYETIENAGKSINRILRYTYHNHALENEVVILGNIPGALFHNGGRMAFGPDGYLYVTTGDAQNPELSQDTTSLAGKILRITEDGGIPQDNPFSNEVYSYGHRNAQGLAWDDDGALWSTEHGRSGVRSGLDELNLIIKGENYGWPQSQGDIVLDGTVGPVIHSGPNTTWAPGGATFIDDSLFFGGLRAETLYEARIVGIGVTELETHFVGEFGRIRTTILGPDGFLYLMTSNRDGRGEVSEGDDKIIRVDVTKL